MFAETWNWTSPLPVPLALVKVIQEEVVEALHEQDGDEATTEKLPAVLTAVKSIVRSDNVNEHVGVVGGVVVEAD